MYAIRSYYGQRLKALMKLGLPCGGHRGQSPAMEGAGQGDDLKLARSAVNTRELDRGLIGLGTGVAHEDPVGKAVVDQQFRQLDLRLCMEQVRHMHQGSGLAADRLGHHRMAVPQGTDGNAGKKIKILLAVRVPNFAPAPLRITSYNVCYTKLLRPR